MRTNALATVVLALALPYQGIAQSLDFVAPKSFCHTQDSTINSLGTGDFTVEAMIKGEESDQVDVHQPILSNRGAGVGLLFFIHSIWGGSNYPMLSIQLKGHNYLILNNGTYNGPLLDGTCHHVAITRNEDTLTFYVDGSAIGSTLVVPLLESTFCPGRQELIGGDYYNDSYFVGTISQVRIWDRALTPSEVIKWGGVDIAGTTPGLRSYWKLNEGSGQLGLDAAGNADMILGWSANNTNRDPQWSTSSCADRAANDMQQPGQMQREMRYANGTGDLVIGPGTAGLATWVSVSDPLGRLVLDARQVSEAGEEISIGSLPTGIYVAELCDGQQRKTLRFFKQP